MIDIYSDPASDTVAVPRALAEHLYAMSLLGRWDQKTLAILADRLETA